MLRPERITVGDSCCIKLTGESPVAVSADAPRSRPRAPKETLPSEWGVKSPQRVVRPVGGEQLRRPSIKRTLQPREISNRKVGWPSRSCHGEGNRLRRVSDGRRTPAGYRGEHAETVGYGTGETRPGGQRQGLCPCRVRAKAVRISRWRKRNVPGGSPRGS